MLKQVQHDTVTPNLFRGLTHESLMYDKKNIVFFYNSDFSFSDRLLFRKIQSFL